MNTRFDKYTQRIMRADQLIRMQATGSPNEFAKKLNISKSHLYNLLEEFRILGLELSYSKSNQTYQYKRPIRLKIELNITFLDNNELLSIDAGNNFLLYLHRSNFFGMYGSTLALQ